MSERSRPLVGTQALVTGASRRIGKSIALRLGREGADVAVHYRSDPEGAREVTRALDDLGVRSVALRADLTDAAACARLVDEAEDALGGLGLLVNNAATFARTPVESMTIEDFDSHMSANARSVYALSLSAGRRFQKHGVGCIVNIADTAGLRPWPAFIPYSASKAAVVSLTLGFAKALAPEVRVNAIAPGPMLPPAGEPPEQGEKAVRATVLKRWGHPDDIAGAVAYLATASYVTGVILPVDGGRSIA